MFTYKQYSKLISLFLKNFDGVLRDFFTLFELHLVTRFSRFSAARFIFLIALVSCSSLISSNAYAQSIDASLRFDPDSIRPTETSSLTITLTNTNIAQASDVALLYTPPNTIGLFGSVLSNTCGGTAQVISGQLDLTGATIPARVNTTSGSCEYSVSVRPQGIGNLITTIPAGALASSNVGSNTDPASATLQVLADPLRVEYEIGSPTSFANAVYGGTTDTFVRVSITNLNTFDISGLAFTEQLNTLGPRDSLRALSSPAPRSSCGTVSIAADGGSFSLTGGSLAASTTCEVEVYVQPQAPVTQLNERRDRPARIDVGQIETDQFVSNDNQSEFLYDVFTGIRLLKNFRPDSVDVSGETSLEINIRNYNATSLVAQTLTDILPAGMTFSLVPGLNLRDPCGIIDTTDPTRIVVSDINLAGAPRTSSSGIECDIFVDVDINAAGEYRNEIGGPSQPFTDDQGNTIIPEIASDTLNVSDTGNLSILLELENSTNPRNIRGVLEGNDINGAIILSNAGAVAISGIDIANNIRREMGFRYDLYPDSAVFTGTGCIADSIVSDAATDIITVTNATVPGATTCRVEFRLFNGSRSGRVQNALLDQDLTVNGARLGIDVQSPFLRSSPLLRTFTSFSPSTVGSGGISRTTVSVSKSSSSRATDIQPQSLQLSGFMGPVRVASDPDFLTTCDGGNFSSRLFSGLTFTEFENSDFPATSTSTCNIELDLAAPTGSGSQRSSFSARITLQNVPTNSGTYIAGSEDFDRTLTWGPVEVAVTTVFSPNVVDSGNVSTLQIEIDNTATGAIPLSEVAITDLLPSGMIIAAIPNAGFSTVSGTCTDGVVTALQGSNQVSLSNATIDAGSRCRISVDVVTTRRGNVTNDIPVGAITSRENATNSQPAVASLLSNSGVSVLKAFSPATVNTGETSTVTITIVNATQDQLNLSSGSGNEGLVDTLPTGLSISSSPNFTAQCGLNIASNAGSTAVLLSGGVIPPDDVCLVTFDVVAPTVGTFVNEIPAGALSFVAGQPATNATAASATLTVVNTPTESLRLTKTAGAATVAGGTDPNFTDAGDTVDYTFVVTNTGNTAIDNVVVTDGGAVVSGSAIATLAPGASDTTTFTARRTLTAADILAGGYENSALVTGASTITPGTSVTDISDPGDGSETTNDPDLGEAGDANGTADDDADPTNDPTVVRFTQVEGLRLTKTAGAATVAGGTDPNFTDAGDTVDYTFVVTNTGNTAIDNVVVTDGGAVVSGSAIATLAPGETDTTTFTARRTLTDGDILAGGYENSALVTGASTITPGTSVTDISDPGDGSETTNDPDLGEAGDANGTADDDADPTNDPTVVRFVTAPPTVSGLLVEKTASRQVVRIGEILSYSISVTNTSSSPVTGVNIVDFLPPGLTFQTGSALVEGAPVNPVFSGRRLTFDGQDVAANDSITITFNVAISASATAFEFENLAWVENATTGVRISNIGIAIVRREIEHVFDCGEIIGKVFDDKNNSGYQDQGELGLPGVRVASAKGELITTDKHGRFHVPCASIPDANIGSNFILKIDERTLPTGYRVTTENPRVIRLTRGKLSKVNFGVSTSRVVRIDVNRAAFNGDKPSAALARAIPKLVDHLGKQVSVLRLNYKFAREGKKLARERINNLSRMIEYRWKREGNPYDLQIETRILAKN